MNILIVGAGAIGGYFGGRLLEKGLNVTFLVREKRKASLEENGLKIVSNHGNSVQYPKLITTTNHTGVTFDLIILSTKSYHLEQAIKDIRPFIDEKTIILPLLNGIAHIEQLINSFGEDAVIGGLCFIETTLDEDGTIIQKSPIHELVYGERSGQITPRIQKLQSIFKDANASFELSETINQDMWQKYLFISTMSGVTSLMESPIGPIMELANGRNTVESLLNEIAAVMYKIGAPIKDAIANDLLQKINEMAYDMKSSMQRDMEKLLPLETDHLQGFLLRHANEQNISVPILETIYTKLSLYENSIN